ncbi:MAG: asparagine synthetase B [Phycisphaerales bacterium]|nr:MAG: asparagine synthetase B [Phycisphaerales bacterium]
MCGLAAVLRFFKAGEAPHPLESIAEAWLDVLDASLAHRGPDGNGRFRDRAVRPDGTVVDVALVHRRLSILDHRGGHQPMVHDGQRLRPDLTYRAGQEPVLAHERCPQAGLWAVAFNGCIANHRALRQELSAGRGARFETDHSDTEALLHAWDAWGPGVLDRLDGMHAALVWDRRQAAMASGRDCFGEKPLYADAGPGWMAWASSAAALIRWKRTCLGEPTPIRPAVVAWIAKGWDAQLPLAMRSVPPGSWSMTTGQARRWRPPSRGHGHKGDLGSTSSKGGEGGVSAPTLDHPDAVEAALRSAVRSRLEADVPLGVFLSGGVDSGLIAALARQEAGALRSFTVRMPEPGWDESPLAERTAAALGTEHTTLACHLSPAEDLVALIEQLGLPFGDSSLLPTAWLCRAARRCVKVALSGEGGDELFGGYRRHVAAAWLRRWRRPLAMLPAGLLGQRRPGSASTYLARLVDAARHGGYPQLLAIYPRADLRRLIRDLDRIEPPVQEDAPPLPTDDPLAYDLLTALPEDLMRKADTASMAVALEVRAPMLANELVDAALRTPLDRLMPGNRRKALLRAVAARHLPAEVVDGPKRGFAIPLSRWFGPTDGRLRTLLHDTLGSADPFPGLESAGVWIDRRFVARMLVEHDRACEGSIHPWRGRDHAQRLYVLLVLGLWARWLDRLNRS